MAKSCLPLAAMTCALVLVVGCGGEESMASRSARAFREAQEHGESVSGEGHDHGHGAAASGEVAHERADGTKAAAKEDAPAHVHDGPAAEAHTGGHGAEHEAVTHDASKRGHAKSAGGAAAARQRAPTSPAPSGHPPTDDGAAADHAAMGHAAAPAAAHASPAMTPQAVHVAAAAPVAAGAPAATLAPDAIDAPAPSAVADAHLAAAASAGEHGGHAAHGASTYRQLDAGRTTEPQPAPTHHEPNGQGPGRAAHDDHDHGANHAAGSKGNAP